MSDEVVLLKILAACERTAAATERLAGIAEEGRHERKSAPAMTSEQAATHSVTRPKGDILTVTASILHFGVFCDRSGNPKTTKKGNQYWQLKLSSGFEAMVFSSSQAATCQKAFDEDRPLIVDYVISGEYQNIEDVRLGAMAAAQPRHVTAAEDDDEVPF